MRNEGLGVNRSISVSSARCTRSLATWAFSRYSLDVKKAHTRPATPADDLVSFSGYRFPSQVRVRGDVSVNKGPKHQSTSVAALPFQHKVVELLDRPRCPLKNTCEDR